MNIVRTKCVLCNGIILPYWSVPKVAVCTSATEQSPDQDVHADFKVGTCEECLLPQLIELIPLHVLYAKNPPMTQGKLWDRHFEAFSRFIIANTKGDKTFLEIGDPSCKTVSKCAKNGKEFDEWVIMDPNIHELGITVPERCHRVTEWFDPENPPDRKADCIVTSHVFEHFYDPGAALRAFRKISNKLVFSIPNMPAVADDCKLPPIGMMFQHTFYLDVAVARDMFARNGWKIDKTEMFEDNSIFLSASPYDEGYELAETHRWPRRKLNELTDSLQQFIERTKRDLDNKTDTDPVYIFGSHFGTQVLSAMGLSHEKINGVWDNDSRKAGKRLYGTPLKIQTPLETVKKMAPGKKVTVVMYPYQAYWQEIIEGFRELTYRFGVVIDCMTHVTNDGVTWIAHRGNVDGPQSDRENHPDYIEEALSEGYDVEIDVRYDSDTDSWWLGHDEPQYKVDVSFLQDYRLWCHAKTLATLSKLHTVSDVHYFSHSSDPAVLTSKNIIWVQPGEEYDERCICVMPELALDWDLSKPKLGVCSDFVRRLKQSK